MTTINNSDLSVGTESQYSVLSHEQQGGNFLSFLFGDDGKYATKLALAAFKDKQQNVGGYIVKNALENSYTLDFSKIDSSSRNLLHYLVELGCVDTLSKVLEKTNAKKYINKKDSAGNTPAHCALYNDLDSIVKLLETNGADLTIKNNEGYRIVSQNVPTLGNSHFVKQDIKSSPSDIFIKITSLPSEDKSDLGEIESRLNKIVQQFVTKTETDPADTLNFDKLDLETIASQKRSSLPSRVPVVTISETSSQVNDTEVLNNIMNQLNNPMRSQYGGAKKKKTSGSRKMVTYSEVSIGGSSEDDSENSDESDDDEFSDDSEFSGLRRLGRAIEKNASSDLHEASLKRIAEITGLDMKEDIIKIKAIKAIIYDAIKKEKPELSNSDKATELQSRASDEDIVKKILKNKDELEKMIKIIEERQSMKQSSNSNSSSEGGIRRIGDIILSDTVTSDFSNSSSDMSEQ